MEPKLFSPRLFSDERGFFFESYRKGDVEFVQDNVSFSKKGTVRGLHFQSFPGQAKLLTCLSGEIWDVVVDLRKELPTFGKWQGFSLKPGEQIFVPIGFAHGFCALQDAMVQYKVSAFYNPETEKTIRWNDPAIGVAWPRVNPILSDRDRSAPLLEEVVR